MTEIVNRNGAIGKGGEREVYQPTMELIDEKDLIQVDDDLYEEIKEDQLQLTDGLMKDLSGHASGKWLPEHKIMAATYYMILGSYVKTAKYMAASEVPVPSSTIAAWRNKSTWWKPLTNQIRKAKQEELDAKLTHLIHSGVDQLQDRVESGEYVLSGEDEEGNPKLHRVPMKSRDLSIVTGTMHDKRALGRGDPTSRTERVSPQELLKDLAKECEKIANGKTIEAVKTEYTVEENK